MQKGTHCSEETKRKIAVASKGREFSEESRQKMSLAAKGRRHSEETKRKIALAIKGRHHSEEARRKLRLANIGRSVSVETKQKLSVAAKRRRHSEETRRKIAMANRGRRLSDDVKRKISLAVTKSWASNEFQRLALKRWMKHRIQVEGKFVSKTETLFLDSIEQQYHVTIERQYELGGRYYDGRWNNVLIESDGRGGHYGRYTRVNDMFKDYLARSRGYDLHRFVVNTVHEVDDRLQEYHERLEAIFGGNSVQRGTTVDRLTCEKASKSVSCTAA